MPKIAAAEQAQRTAEAVAIGRLLAKAREQAGMSQWDAARALGVPQSRIAKLELGQRQLRFVEALRFARLYGIDVTGLDPSTS